MKRFTSQWGKMCVGERKRQRKKEMQIDIESQLSPECGSPKHCRSNPCNEPTVWETHREFPKHFPFGEDKNNFHKNYSQGLITNTKIVYYGFSQLFLYCGWIKVGKVPRLFPDNGLGSGAHTVEIPVFQVLLSPP